MHGAVEERVAIVAKAAAEAADRTDREGRFPHEAVDEMRRQRLLGISVPEERGGEGVELGDVAACARVIGGACASSAMVFAMHQIQVACLVRHGRTPALEGLTTEVADRQLLLASATSEVNIGGDVRSSICALEGEGQRLHVQKEAPVISYGDEADGILVTARRSPSSPASDQALAACRRSDLTLQRTSTWDTLGFRGTASHGYRLEATLDRDLVLPDGFGDISSQTMLPVSHILWASVWLGLAEAAARTAHGRARHVARKRGPGGAASTRLAELSLRVGQFRSEVTAGLALYGQVGDDPDALGSIGFSIAMNNLKISAASSVVDVVAQALSICGLEGYRQDSPHSLGRLLRDAYGAGLMVNSDRILANNAQLLLATREL